MSAGFTKQLKVLVSDFVLDGKILDKPLGRTIKKDLDDERIIFIRQFLDLLLNTTFISIDTKLYISDRYITLEGVRDKLRDSGEDVNINTLKAKVWYDKNKIVRTFGDRVLVDILEYSNIDMTSYNQRLSKEVNKYYSSNILNGLALNIEDDNINILKGEEVSDEEFMEFVSIIAPYSRKHMKYIEDNLSKSVVGYVNYILKSSFISDKDEDRRRILAELLG